MTRKTAFFEGWTWFKFNNLGLALGTNLIFYTILSKGLKLKVRKFWLILTFVEVTGGKLVGGGPFCPRPILNRVKHNMKRHQIPQKVVYEKFDVHEVAAVDLSKIYFLKNAKKICKPNNRDLNRDSIKFSEMQRRERVWKVPCDKVG